MMQKEEKIATNRSPAVFGRGDKGVRHVGLYARDPAATASLYRHVNATQLRHKIRQLRQAYRFPDFKLKLSGNRL